MKLEKAVGLNHIRLIAESQMAMALESEGLRLDKNSLSQGIQEVLNNPLRGSYYLCFNKENEFLGMLMTQIEWSDWRNQEVLWIHSVYIKPEYRRQGVYSFMYNSLKAEASLVKKIAGIRLYVDKTNLKAQKTYEALGMTNEHYDLYECMDL